MKRWSTWRISFGEAVAAGLLDRNAGGRSASIGSTLYYPDCSYERLLDWLGLTGEEAGASPAFSHARRYKHNKPKIPCFAARYRPRMRMAKCHNPPLSLS